MRMTFDESEEESNLTLRSIDSDEPPHNQTKVVH